MPGFVPRASFAEPRSPTLAANRRSGSVAGLGSRGLVHLACVVDSNPSINTHGVGTYKCRSVSSCAAKGQAVRLFNEPRSLAGGSSGYKFVVSRAGEAYDAPQSEPNRNSRLKGEKGNHTDVITTHISNSSTAEARQGSSGSQILNGGKSCQNTM
jgi:hypothetical protein